MAVGGEHKFLSVAILNFALPVITNTALTTSPMTVFSKHPEASFSECSMHSINQKILFPVSPVSPYLRQTPRMESSYPLSPY